MLPRIAQHATRAAARAAPRSVFFGVIVSGSRMGILEFFTIISLAVLGYYRRPLWSIGVNFAHITRMILRGPSRGPM